MTVAWDYFEARLDALAETDEPFVMPAFVRMPSPADVADAFRERMEQAAENVDPNRVPLPFKSGYIVGERPF